MTVQYEHTEDIFINFIRIYGLDRNTWELFY